MSQNDAFTPMGQPVTLQLRDLSPAPIERTSLAPIPTKYFGTSMRSVPPAGKDLGPPPCIPGQQIFAPPLTMVVLPQANLISQCLPQASAQWTRMPQSFRGQVEGPRLRCPQVPQSGYLPGTNGELTYLPRAKGYPVAPQPSNSTPDSLPWS